MLNNLKVLRAERNWSQQDLAERLEVSRQSVNAIETGKYDPSLPLAFRIAELFDRPIEDIFVSPSRKFQSHLTFKLRRLSMLRTCAFILAGLAAATLDWSAPGQAQPPRGAQQSSAARSPSAGRRRHAHRADPGLALRRQCGTTSPRRSAPVTG